MQKQRKVFTACLLLTCLTAVCLLVGYRINYDSIGNGSVTPTGYPSDEIQRPYVFYNGALYTYDATGFDEPLAEGCTRVGTVKEVDNSRYPDTDFYGCRVDAGQEIYADQENLDTIYLKYDNGYAVFSKEQTSKD